MYSNNIKLKSSSSNAKKGGPVFPVYLSVLLVIRKSLISVTSEVKSLYINTPHDEGINYCSIGKILHSYWPFIHDDESLRSTSSIR